MLHHVLFVNEGRFGGDRRGGDCRPREGQTLHGTAEEDQSRYADDSPHRAVMGIMHLSIAHGPGRREPCPPLPGDVQEHRLPFLGAPGRDARPLEQPELSELGPDGIARPVPDLTGPIAVRGGDAEVRVRNASISPRRPSVPSGAVVRWRFTDPVQLEVRP